MARSFAPCPLVRWCSAAAVWCAAALAVLPGRAEAGGDIVGGEESAPGSWLGVVALEASSGGLCTGTLIHPRLVLTAGHCAGAYASAGSVDVHVGHDLGAPESTLVVDRVGVHPNFCGEPKEDCSDFGYLRLAEPADGALIIPVLDDQADYDAFVGIGDPVTFVGFGRDAEGISGTKRGVETTVSERSTTGVAFMAGGDGKDTCNGDSGGPALVQRGDGQWAVAGVLSYGSAVCGEGGVYGVPHGALCWIGEDSGLEVVPAGCASCDCVDLASLADDDAGCGCSTGSSSRPLGSCLVAIVLAGLFGIRRGRDAA